MPAYLIPQYLYSVVHGESSVVPYSTSILHHVIFSIPGYMESFQEPHTMLAYLIPPYLVSWDAWENAGSPYTSSIHHL